jgi:hypothetical protein
MKKIQLGFIIFILATTIFAQSGVKDQEMEVSIFAGLLTDKDFTLSPLTFAGGMVMDVHLFDFIMISPEMIAIFAKNGTEMQDRSGRMGVGISMNFTPGYPGVFYFGGGVLKRFWFPNEMKTHDSFMPVPLELKLNAGIRTHNRKLRLGFYMLTPFNDLFKSMTFGLYLGFGVFSI